MTGLSHHAPTAFAAQAFETERLILRAPDGRDSPAITDFLMSERARFYGGPVDLDQAWRRLASYAGQWMLRGYGMFALARKDTGETIGLAGPWHPAVFPAPEMAWLLTDPRHEGQGFAFEASRAVLDHLGTTFGWTSMVSYIDRANAASQRLAARLGAVCDPSLPSPMPGCDSYRHGGPEAAG